jgi:hypothetical protein
MARRIGFVHRRRLLLVVTLVVATASGPAMASHRSGPERGPWALTYLPGMGTVTWRCTVKEVGARAYALGFPELQRRGDRAAYFADREPSRAYANDPARAEPEPSASRCSRPRTRGHSVDRAGNTSRDRLGQLRPPTDLALSLLPVVSACDDAARASALAPTEATSLACASSRMTLDGP